MWYRLFHMIPYKMKKKSKRKKKDNMHFLWTRFGFLLVFFIVSFCMLDLLWLHELSFFPSNFPFFFTVPFTFIYVYTVSMVTIIQNVVCFFFWTFQRSNFMLRITHYWWSCHICIAHTTTIICVIILKRVGFFVLINKEYICYLIIILYSIIMYLIFF